MLSLACSERMKNMNVTFEELKRKERNRMDEKTDRIREEEHRLIRRNDDSLRTNDYTEFSYLTTHMQTKYGINGFVYRDHYIDELFDQESYCLLFSFQQCIRKFIIYLKVREEIQQNAQVDYVELDEDWKTKKYCKIEPEVKEIFEEFREVIYDLPEFRLYTVTGMLDYKES